MVAMPPIDDHVSDSLDPNGELVLYVHNQAGQCFGVCCIPPIPPPGGPVYDRPDLDGPGGHTDVQSAIYLQPVYVQQLFPSTEAGTKSLQRNLNPHAPPFSVPPNTPRTDNLSREAGPRYHDLGKEMEPQVAPDKAQAQPSAAARLARKSASRSHERRQSALRALVPSSHPRTVKSKDGTEAREQQRNGAPSTSRANNQETQASVWTDSQGFHCPMPTCTSKHRLFKTQGVLKKHMKSHEPKENLPYGCDFCSFRCRYPRELRRHSVKHETTSEGEDRFPCPYCPKTYGRSDNRKRHVERVHPDLPIPPTPFGLITRAKTANSSNFTTFYEQEFPLLPSATPLRSITHD